jgi:hypothetical protein
LRHRRDFLHADDLTDFQHGDTVGFVFEHNGEIFPGE